VERVFSERSSNEIVSLATGVGDYKPAIPSIVHSKAARLRHDRIRQTCAFTLPLAQIAAVPVDLNQAAIGRGVTILLNDMGQAKKLPALLVGRLQRQRDV